MTFFQRGKGSGHVRDRGLGQRVPAQVLRAGQGESGHVLRAGQGESGQVLRAGQGDSGQQNKVRQVNKSK